MNVFEGKKPNYKIYIVANVTLTISLTVFTLVALNLFYNLIESGKNHFFISEFADRLVYYSSAILAMLSFLHIFIHAFRFNLNKTNNILNELSKNSYSVYIIHMIVLGVVALALIHLPVHGAIKFMILSASTFLLSNMMVYYLQWCQYRYFGWNPEKCLRNEYGQVREEIFVWTNWNQFCIVVELSKRKIGNTFVDLNVRYMNVDGNHEDAQLKYEAFFIVPEIG